MRRISELRAREIKHRRKEDAMKDFQEANKTHPDIEIPGTIQAQINAALI